MAQSFFETELLRACGECELAWTHACEWIVPPDTLARVPRVLPRSQLPPELRRRELKLSPELQHYIQHDPRLFEQQLDNVVVFSGVNRVFRIASRATSDALYTAELHARCAPLWTELAAWLTCFARNVPFLFLSGNPATVPGLTLLECCLTIVHSVKPRPAPIDEGPALAIDQLVNAFLTKWDSVRLRIYKLCFGDIGAASSTRRSEIAAVSSDISECSRALLCDRRLLIEHRAKGQFTFLVVWYRRSALRLAGAKPLSGWVYTQSDRSNLNGAFVRCLDIVRTLVHEKRQLVVGDTFRERCREHIDDMFALGYITSWLKFEQQTTVSSAQVVSWFPQTIEQFYRDINAGAPITKMWMHPQSPLYAEFLWFVLVRALETKLNVFDACSIQRHFCVRPTDELAYDQRVGRTAHFPHMVTILGKWYISMGAGVLLDPPRSSGSGGDDAVHEIELLVAWWLAIIAVRHRSGNPAGLQFGQLHPSLFSTDPA